MAEASRNLLLATVKDLLTSGKFSDFTIKCDSDSYKVHKNIVVTRADFFALAIRFGGKETEHNEIDLPADKRPIVKLLIQYLYEAEYDPILPTFTASTNTGNSSSPQTAPHTCSNNSNHYHCNSYSQHRWVCPHHYCGSQCKYTCTDFVCDQCITVKGDANQLLIHAQMYEMADKYDVIGLKTLSKEKFRLACIKFWDHPGFTRAAYHAYTTTPDNDTGLRSIIRETLSDHMVLLRKPMVKNLMTKFNGLSFDLLMAKAEQAGWCNK